MTKDNQILFVLSNNEITDPATLDGLWTATTEMRRVISRRAFVEKGYEHISASKAVFMNLDGSKYYLPDDDELFGNDPDFRWLDNCFLAKDVHGNRLRTPSPRTYERLRFIDLFFQIALPHTVSSSYR